MTENHPLKSTCIYGKFAMYIIISKRVFIQERGFKPLKPQKFNKKDCTFEIL